MKSLETYLRALRATGRKSLVPYFVAGLTPDWLQHVEAAAHAGADAIEIGIPFSDPMMDGVVIQEAAFRALERGTTLDSVCAELAGIATSIPLITMTYYNIFHHYGLERSTGTLRAAGVTGAIVPDLPLEEADEWIAACATRDVATIFLVAPSSPADRISTIATATEGFCYASARMAVTGRSSDAGEGSRVVNSVREVSDIPTFIGIGIASPEQARDAAALSDGVIVGSALVQLILDGATSSDVEDFVGSFRRAIDGGAPTAR